MSEKSLRTASDIFEYFRGIQSNVDFIFEAPENDDQSLESLLGDLDDEDKEDSSTDTSSDISSETNIDNDKESRDSESLETGNVEFEDIINKLNTLRSGRSLKDDAVRDEFRDYFDKLDEEERIALYAYLKGISGVLTSEQTGDNATDPSDPEPDIEMKKGKKGSEAFEEIAEDEPEMTQDASSNEDGESIEANTETAPEVTDDEETAADVATSASTPKSKRVAVKPTVIKREKSTPKRTRQPHANPTEISGVPETPIVPVK